MAVGRAARTIVGAGGKAKQSARRPYGYSARPHFRSVPKGGMPRVAASEVLFEETRLSTLVEFVILTYAHDVSAGGEPPFIIYRLRTSVGRAKHTKKRCWRLSAD
jgi:hypothetical protein